MGRPQVSRVKQSSMAAGTADLRDLIRGIRDELLSTEDTVCLQRARLVTKAYRRYEGEAVPLKRAKAFAHVLRHMDLDLTSNPIFAGNTSSRPRAWMLVPEHGFSQPPQVLLENEGLEDLLDGQIPPDLLAYWADRSAGGAAGIGHLAVDLDRVVHEGLEAMLAELDAYGAELDAYAGALSAHGDAAQREYRQAMAIALRAVIDWSHRYAGAAERAARTAVDPTLRFLHRRVAAACRQVPARPARDLFEGLQAIVLVHLALAIEGHGMSVSIGLPDRVLAPLIGDDLDAEQATDLIAAFMLKVAANSVFGRGSKTQAITVGGADHLGRDCSNALTLCFLDACDLVRIGDPHLFLRWHPGLDNRVRRRAFEMLASGLSMPLLINDEPTARGFVDAGVRPEDAREYCVIGCNELGIPGRSAESATSTSGLIQHLELLNQTLLQHPDPDAIGDMSQLLRALEERMRRDAFAARERAVRNRQSRIARVPTPFTSALMRGCIARGKDMQEGMDCHLPGLYERGLTNAANALAAIEQVVFGEKALSMHVLIEAMANDFEDRWSVQSRLLAAPKWGNDDPQVDRWARALVEMRERVLDEVDAAFGHAPHVVCHVVRSLHHFDGQRIAASPDGRRAWTPVADSIGAQAGTARGGPTATLNSVLELDAARYYRGGYNLNLTLSRDATTVETLAALVESFFAQGGQELQVNCFDGETLRAAQQCPAQHGDLVVRVAGFSARFVDLSTVEQEELIARADLLA